MERFVVTEFVKPSSEFDISLFQNYSTFTLLFDTKLHIGLRRLSATLDEMEEKANDSQSEDEDKMESYGEESLRSEKVQTEGSKSNEADEDSIQLGEEGKEFNLLGTYINSNQLKVAFFQKVRFVFQISKSLKKNIPKNYPELEI